MKSNKLQRTVILSLGAVFLAAGSQVRADVAPPVEIRMSLETRQAVSDKGYVGTFEVEVTLDRSRHKLVSGFIAKVDIEPSKSESYFIIPVESLVEGDGRSGFVYLLDKESGIARKNGVEIGHIFDREIAVSSGLSIGDSVISKGVEYLSDGSRVRASRL